MTTSRDDELLSDEAVSLYQEAKRISFAGEFGRAEAKHRASAILFDDAGQSELAARALCRAVWYKIQQHDNANLSQLIESALQKSDVQAEAGLHQAFEFVFFEGHKDTFDICQLWWQTILRTRGIEPSDDTKEPAHWLKVWLEQGARIYGSMVTSTFQARHPNWVRSDEARKCYFDAYDAESYEKISLLDRAASLFDKHEIAYRAHLCRAEAHLWRATLSGEGSEAGKHLENALLSLRSVGHFSRGLMEYVRAVQILTEQLLESVSLSGYVPDKISLSSIRLGWELGSSRGDEFYTRLWRESDIDQRAAAKPHIGGNEDGNAHPRAWLDQLRYLYFQRKIFPCAMIANRFSVPRREAVGPFLVGPSHGPADKSIVTSEAQQAARVGRVRALLNDWARGLFEKVDSDGVYLFGSLVHRDGLQFGQDSDVDLVVRFPTQPGDPLARVRWLGSLLSHKLELERQLIAILDRGDVREPICSVVVPSQIEIGADIHKDGAERFFTGNRFVLIPSGVQTDKLPGAGEQPIDNPLTRQVFRLAQKQRNSYLAVSADGTGQLVSYNGSDPVPKGLMRQAAMVAAVNNPQSVVGNEYDTQGGLDFLANHLYGLRGRGAAYAQLQDQVSVRRGARGPRGPLSVNDLLLISEILCDAAQLASGQLAEN